MRRFLESPKALWLVPPLAAAAYGHVVTFAFVWDDKNLIAENPFLTQPSTLWRAFTHGFWELTNAPAGTPMYRPLVLLSYLAERAVWGAAPAGFHAMNLLLHAGASVLVGLLAARLWDRPAAALPAALLFLAHPAQQEAVANIASRTDLMATAFGLAGTLLWLTGPPGAGAAEAPPSLRRSLLTRAGALALLAGALLSKESAVIWPATWYLLRAARDGSHRPVRTDAAPFVVLVAYLVLRSTAVAAVPISVSAEGWQGGTRLAHLLLRMLWPTPIAPTWEPTALPLGVQLGLLALLGAALGAFLWRVRGAIPRALVASALVGLLPVSEVIPLGARFADLLLYTPLAFVALLVGGVAALAVRAGWWIALTLGVALLPLTASRASVYASDLTLWSHAVALDPTDPTARLNHANALRGAKRSAEGCAALRALDRDLRAAGSPPPSDRVAYNLGNCALEARDYAAGADAFGRAWDLSRGALWQAARNRVLSLVALGRREEAVRAADALAAAHPGIAETHETAAVVLAQGGRFTEAVARARRALALRPGDPRLAALLAQLERDARAQQR